MGLSSRRASKNLPEVQKALVIRESLLDLVVPETGNQFTDQALLQVRVQNRIHTCVLITNALIFFTKVSIIVFTLFKFLIDM